jgi:tyrosinase
MSIDPSRRDFLRSSASWATGLALAPFLGACEGCAEQIRNRPVRRSLATLTPTDPIIETYRDAVAAMKALPATDGRSWQAQSQIHNNHCPHGNWFFLPWHRAYLNYFEAICRNLTGNADFALPYWDWTADAHVPAPFWGATANALFHAGRTATAASTANPLLVGRPEIDDILDETDFLLFGSGVATMQRQVSVYGRLEGTPHNHVHGFVGGDMGTYVSPLDPIFWMHHNMIECLWVEWNLVRQNANPSDAQWTGFQFTGNFFDTSGNSADIAVGTTLLMPMLAYQFDGECGGPGGAERMRAALADSVALRAFLERGGPLRLEVVQRFPMQQAFELTTRMPVSARMPLPPEAIRAMTDLASTERLLLRVEAITPPRSESFFVRVFVDLPAASPETPADDPHYAGSFAFFHDPAHQIDTAAGAGAYIVDLSATLRRLNAAAQLTSPVPINFVAVPIEAGRGIDDAFTVRDVSLELARVRAQTTTVG